MIVFGDYYGPAPKTVNPLKYNPIFTGALLELLKSMEPRTSACPHMRGTVAGEKFWAAFVSALTDSERQELQIALDDFSLGNGYVR